MLHSCLNIEQSSVAQMSMLVSCCMTTSTGSTTYSELPHCRSPDDLLFVREFEAGMFASTYEDLEKLRVIMLQLMQWQLLVADAALYS